MPNCQICRMPTERIGYAANDNGDDAAICIPPPEVMSQPYVVHRLALAYRAKNLPRRKILNFVAEHLYLHERLILYKGRYVSFADDIDEIFGTDRDPSERWLSNFLSFAIEAPRQRAQHRTLDRLTLLWTALAVHNPVQAALVIK